MAEASQSHLSIMKTKLLGVVGLSVILRWVASGAEVGVGMSEAALVAEKGEPQAKMVAGDKAIYRWPDMVVTLTQARVVAIDRRDLPRERAEQVRRSAMLAEIARKAEIERQRVAEAAAKQAAEEERLRPQREMAALKAKVEKLEKEKAEQAASLQRQIDNLASARQAEIYALSQTVDATGYYYRKAKAEGDTKKAEVLLHTLLGQQQQLAALTGAR